MGDHREDLEISSEAPTKPCTVRRTAAADAERYFPTAWMFLLVSVLCWPLALKEATVRAIAPGKAVARDRLEDTAV